jgi:hypothetical protein
MNRRFFTVNSIDILYGCYNCADSCGNLFRLFPDQDLNPEWVGKKISVDSGLISAYIVKDIKLEPRLR